MLYKNESKGRITWYTIAIVFSSVIAICVIAWFLINRFIPCPGNRGLFGDQFGVVNALFSGLAFAGLIITLILQNKDLSLQREELEQTRCEFKEQNTTMKRQRFENTFFNLLSLHQHLTDNLEYECLDGDDYFEAKGREVFKKFYLEKKNFDEDETCGVKGFLRNREISSFKSYSDIHIFSHYFNFFDGIIRYIDNSNLLEENERYQYSVILRNTLSDSERYMLFYFYASCDLNHKQLVEKYALFCDVEPCNLANNEHYGTFSSTAFAHSS